MQEQKTMGRTILILLLCIMGSFLTVSIFMPRFIEWYAAPVMPQGVSCVPTIQWAIAKMLWFQTASVILGTIVGVILSFKLRKRVLPPSQG